MGPKEDILDQDEIDALLKGMGGGDIETETDTSGKTEGVSTFDFTNQERIVRGRFPALDVITERFSRCFQRTIVDMVQSSVEVVAGEVKIIKMNEYLRNLFFPTSLNIVKIDALGGVALITIDSKLIFSVIELYYGGNGQIHFKIEGREYTTVEMGLIRNLVTECLKCLTISWEPVIPIDIEVLHSEMNPKFASIVDPIEMVVISPVYVRFENQEGRIDIVMPYSMLEPIRDVLEEGMRSLQGEGDKRWNKTLRDEAKDIEVALSAELAQVHMSMEDLLAMEVGDVIPIEMPSLIPVKVEDIVIGHGRLGDFEGKKAVQLMDFTRHPAYRDREVPLEW
ncbi:MAG: flagellar motor switch protein FliM [Thiotrichales bacterium]|nr:flagellar motor switch protein FliM [Thiotrichales bacterium]